MKPPWDDETAAALSTHIGWEVYSCAWAARQLVAPTVHLAYTNHDDIDCAGEAFRDLVLLHARVVHEFFLNVPAARHDDDMRVRQFDADHARPWDSARTAEVTRCEQVLDTMVREHMVNKYVLHPSWQRATGPQMFELLQIAVAATDLGAAWLAHLRATRPGAAALLPATIDRALNLMQPMR